MAHAGRLIEHYDRWLEEFDRLRSESNPKPESPFVFVGPSSYPFPKEAEQAFVQRFRDDQLELYETV